MYSGLVWALQSQIRVPLWLAQAYDAVVKTAFLITLCLVLSSSVLGQSPDAEQTPESCRKAWSQSWRKDDAPGAIAFMKQLQAAVTKDDRMATSGMMQYPLRISGEYRIHNRTAFLRNYDRIFDAKVREAVTKQVPECIFGNWQGFMAGLGDVWFARTVDDPTFLVISVNTASWPKRQKVRRAGAQSGR